MNTVLDNLRNESLRLRSILERLNTHSAIKRWNYNNGNLIWTGGDYSWEKLDNEGRQIQSKALEEYRKFFSILQLLRSHSGNYMVDGFRRPGIRLLRQLCCVGGGSKAS
jgi:hypothetical protein